MLFALICTDKPNSLELRISTRPIHVDYLKSLGKSLKLAGPFTGADNNPNGSLVVIEAADHAAAVAMAAADPYAKAGLFQSVDIRPWIWTLNNPDQAKV